MSTQYKHVTPDFSHARRELSTSVCRWHYAKKLVLLCCLTPIGAIEAETRSTAAYNADSTVLYTDIGIGVGLPYSGLGIAVDQQVLGRLSATASVGIAPHADSTQYNVGFKYQLRKSGRWQPRLSVLYGSNTLIENICAGVACGQRRYGSYEGFSAGFGQRIMLGSSYKHAVDFDVLYAFEASEVADVLASRDRDGVDYTSHSQAVKISIGYRFRF